MWILEDTRNNEILHAVLGYVWQGEYCGDYELPAENFLNARIAHDYRDVKEKLPAHKHIPDPLPSMAESQILHPTRHSVKLPPC